MTIAAGEQLGLTAWTRFNPTGEKFMFSEYLELFLEALGEKIDVFNTLDGRQLVPYQAAVLQRQWSSVRFMFGEAFSLQKTAYRRANGGTTAPNVHEDVKPRFLPQPPGAQSLPEETRPPATHKIVVRRTFLEVETDDEDIDFECFERHGRRYGTDSVLCTDRMIP